MRSTCSVEGCDREVHGNGYCSAHYQRWCKGDIRADEPVSAKADIRHGTLQGYNRRCRCDDCRRAKAEYRISRRDQEQAAVRAWFDEHREAYNAGRRAFYATPEGKAAMARYRAEHAEEIKAAKRRHYEKSKEYRFTYALRTKYGLSREQYDALFLKQNGTCAICGTPPRGSGRDERLHVDHDHSCCPTERTCGRCIRGLLCRACNHALGAFQDNTVTLGSAIKYLKRYAPSS